MVTLTVLRVFVDLRGRHGNPMRIVIDEGRDLDDATHIGITRKTGFSECVFFGDVN